MTKSGALSPTSIASADVGSIYRLRLINTTATAICCPASLGMCCVPFDMGAVFGVTMMGIKLRSFDDIIADATLLSGLVTIS